MTGTTTRFLTGICLCFLLAGCVTSAGQVSAPEQMPATEASANAVPEQSPSGPTATPSPDPTPSPDGLISETSVDATEQSPSGPTATPSPDPTPTSHTPTPDISTEPTPPQERRTPVDETVVYQQLPEIGVSVETMPLASPSNPVSYLSSDPIPAGGRVRVIGTDTNGAWLLVLHGNTLGWIPAFFSGTLIGTLELPVVAVSHSDACARYLDAALAPEETWASRASGSFLIQSIIYRPQPEGPTKEASLAIEIEGGEQLSASNIDHTPLAASGEVLVFTFALDDLEEESETRFHLTGFDNEPLSFQAAFFSCSDDGAGEIAMSTQDTQPQGDSPAPQRPIQVEPTPTFTPIIVTSGPRPTPTPEPALASKFAKLWKRYQTELGNPHQERELGADTIYFVEQWFERGHMFFFGSGHVNFVIVKYGTVEGGKPGSGAWQSFPSEPWSGKDENFCNEGNGLENPVYDNFNKVWCFEPGIRDNLGYPRDVDSRVRARLTGADNAQHVLAQGFDNGFILRDSDGAGSRLAYVFLNNGTYIRDYY